MTDKSVELRQKLIRNFNQVERTREHRPPLYDTSCARLASGARPASWASASTRWRPACAAVRITSTMPRRRPSSC
jgi:hypothetical protein